MGLCRRRVHLSRNLSDFMWELRTLGRGATECTASSGGLVQAHECWLGNPLLAERGEGEGMERAARVSLRCARCAKSSGRIWTFSSVSNCSVHRIRYEG